MPIFDEVGTIATARLGAVAQGLRNLLPVSTRTISTALTHPGPRATISESDHFLKLPNVKGGYRVFDSSWAFRYAIQFDVLWQDRYDQFGPAVEIPEFHFGYDTEDEVFFSTLRPGDYFYVMYDSRPRTGSQTEPTVMVVIVVDNNKIGATPSVRAGR
jgi:hypothetical protein